MKVILFLRILVYILCLNFIRLLALCSIIVYIRITYNIRYNRFSSLVSTRVLIANETSDLDSSHTQRSERPPFTVNE